MKTQVTAVALLAMMALSMPGTAEPADESNGCETEIACLQEALCDFDGNCLLECPPEEPECTLVDLDPPGMPDVWSGIDFTGGCTGTLSKSEFKAEAGGAKIETPLVTFKLFYAEVTIEKIFFKVECGAAVTPWANGENGFLRTVWLEQDGVKDASCAYSGLPGETTCARRAEGSAGVAGSAPMVGSLQDGFAPDHGQGCYVGPAIRATGSGYQGIDDVIGDTLANPCQTLGIDWQDTDGVTMPLEELIQSVMEDIGQGA